MTAVRNNGVSSLFGTKGQVGVNRGIAEFHAGRPVLITGGGETLLTLPVEGLDARRLAEFMALCAPVLPQLVITARRALALGFGATTPVALPLTADFDVDIILALVADAKVDRRLKRSRSVPRPRPPSSW
jgi:GTP cyclohydrolase II